jgi:hypothetical protein
MFSKWGTNCHCTCNYEHILLRDRSTQMFTCMEAFVQVRNCASEFLAKHQMLLPTDGGSSSVDGQCCNIYSPYWVLHTGTFWASLKMLLMLQWSAGFMQLTQFTSLVARADASVEAVILLKSSGHVCVFVYFINLFVTLHAVSQRQFVTWCGLSLVQCEYAVCRLSSCV